MRKPKHLPSSATALGTQNNPSIPPNAKLDIATTAQSKPERRTKRYRAIERPDGIIVERPRYRPAGSSQKPTIKFKQKPVPSNYNGTQRKSPEKPRSSDTGYDLVGMGTSFCIVSTDNIGSDVLVGLLGRGRAGYNEEATCENASVHVVAGRIEEQLCHGSTPMARFLSEEGPWSSFSLEQVPKELLRSYTPPASEASKGTAVG